ncbi:WD40 repeat protein [Giardia duodenalis]|uniref:Peroxin-7 n=1 Tax=Giardia intestinalis (strain ATCC 50803 / WB clone C6) TaxID=184922 RepID=A8BVI7_GIAIC|nr:WD40 repeat protein [Giardia intestinalis]KAE8304502.1 WD40 repeat protein [Giardia intestinalis]|eukprot:XP_001704564.1 Ser/Thr protein kinase pkwA, putative [Giardia lamblia ATCC 50803]
MKLDKIELTYYPPSVTISYTSRHTQSVLSETVAVPHCMTSLNTCVQYLAQSNRFLAHYKAQTDYVASTLLAAQEVNLKYKYAPRAVVTSELLPITSCKLDKSGELAVVTSHDRTAKIYDLSSIVTSKARLSERSILEGHEGVVYTAELSYPDAAICGTASFDGSCRLWNTDTGAPMGVLMVADDVCEFLSVAFSRVSPKLFAAGNASGSVYIWDVCRPDDPFASLPHIHAEEVISIYFDHRSDHRLLSASFDGGVQVHDLRVPLGVSASGSTSTSLRSGSHLSEPANLSISSKLLTKHPAEITAIDMDTNLTTVISASSDGLYRITDLRAPESPLYEHNFGSEVLSCSMSLSKQYTAISVSHGEGGVGDNISLPDMVKRKKIQKRKKGEVDVYVIDNDQHSLAGVLHGHIGEVNLVKFLAPGFGNRIVTCSNDRTLRVWGGPEDLKKSCAEVARLDGHMDAVATFDISYDASVIISASVDNVFRVWSAK